MATMSGITSSLSQEFGAGCSESLTDAAGLNYITHIPTQSQIGAIYTWCSFKRHPMIQLQNGLE